MKLNIRNNFLMNFSKLVIVISLLFNFETAKASDFVFYCKPWKDQRSKISKENNFSIKINNGSLTILGGDQQSRFASLIFTHPNFYLFASPSGSLINISRNEGSKKIRYWEYLEGEDNFYLSKCNN